MLQDQELWVGTDAQLGLPIFQLTDRGVATARVASWVEAQARIVALEGYTRALERRLEALEARTWSGRWGRLRRWTRQQRWALQGMLVLAWRRWRR